MSDEPTPSRISSLETQFASMESRFSSHEEQCKERQDRMNARMSGVEERLSSLERTTHIGIGVLVALQILGPLVLALWLGNGGS